MPSRKQMYLKNQEVFLNDLLPSVGDSGSSLSSTAKRTVVPNALLGTKVFFIDDPRGSVVLVLASNLAAKGVLWGVAGVVDARARALAREARLDGLFRYPGVAAIGV